MIRILMTVKMRMMMMIVKMRMIVIELVIHTWLYILYMQKNFFCDDDDD